MKLLSIIASIKFLLLVASVAFSQVEKISKTSLKNLPYEKNKKQDYISLNISGGFAVETSQFDNTYLISLTPRFHNYLNSRFEIISDYTFIFQKLGSLANNKKRGFNQISSSLRFFPSKKINIFYTETGLQFGNYALRTDSLGNVVSFSKWHPDLLFGIGLELLPKKRKRIFDFEIRYALPLTNGLRFDFIRSIGFGTRIHF